MKILIIDDNKEFTRMLSIFLQEEGFEVVVALSGKDGIKAALAFHPDLILLDYNLGDMTGYDVAVAIKHMQNTAGIPFIVLSSLGADPLLVRGFKKMSNCKTALVKTQPLAAMLVAIREILPAA